MVFSMERVQGPMNGAHMPAFALAVTTRPASSACTSADQQAAASTSAAPALGAPAYIARDSRAGGGCGDHSDQPGGKIRDAVPAAAPLLACAVCPLFVSCACGGARGREVTAPRTWKRGPNAPTRSAAAAHGTSWCPVSPLLARARPVAAAVCAAEQRPGSSVRRLRTTR